MLQILGVVGIPGSLDFPEAGGDKALLAGPVKVRSFFMHDSHMRSVNEFGSADVLLDGVAAETGAPGCAFRENAEKILSKILGGPEPYGDLDRHIARRQLLLSRRLKR